MAVSEGEGTWGADAFKEPAVMAVSEGEGTCVAEAFKEPVSQNMGRGKNEFSDYYNYKHYTISFSVIIVSQ